MGSMEGNRWEVMGLIFTPMLVRCLLGPPGLSRHMTSSSWTHSYSNSPIGGYNSPPASLTPTISLLAAHPPIFAIRDITVVVKKIAQNPAVLANYKR